jgi:glycine cleavage system H protein
VSEFLEYTLDKFTFRVATDRFYNAEGVWAKAEGAHIMVGLSDFFQQHHGDVAFAEVTPAGTDVTAGDTFATIETIKVDIDLPCPLSGVILEVNEAMDLEAEIINQDPYGQGWLAIIEATDWPADQAELLESQAYFEHMQAEAESINESE